MHNVRVTEPPSRMATRSDTFMATGPSTPMSILPDAESMKRDVRANLIRPKHDVADYYHTTGFTQWLARQPRFEQVTVAAVLLNCIWIWIDTDFNPGTILLNSPPLFQCMEHLFCAYFSFEWAMRACAFKRKRDGLRDRWFVFDTIIMLLMVFESWVVTTLVLVWGGREGSGHLGNSSILRIARLTRLTRMARMARLLRAMPELVILIKGMFAAMRSVVVTIGLLGVILYIFSVAFVQLCDGSDCEELFPSVIAAMHSLLLNAALMDNITALITPLQEHNPFLVFILYLFILMASLLMMNLLIGVICEVVSAVAVAEREHLDVGFVIEQIDELMADAGISDGTDQHADGMISRNEFVQLLSSEKALDILSKVGVDTVSLLNLQDFLFASDTFGADLAQNEEQNELTSAEFKNLVLEMRGGNSTTVKDIVQLRNYIDSCFARLEERMKTQLECSNSDMTVVFREPSSAALTSSSNTPKVDVSTSPMPSKVEQTATFLEIFSSLQGLAAKMVSEYKREVAVLQEQSAEVAALREQSAMLETKLKRLKKYARPTPAGAMCNVETRDATDVDGYHHDVQADSGLDYPGVEDVSVRLQCAVDTEGSHASSAWTGAVRQVTTAI